MAKFKLICLPINILISKTIAKSVDEFTCIFVFGIKWPRFLCRCSFSHETKLSNFVVSTASLHPCFSSDLAEFTWLIWQYWSYLRYFLCVANLWCCHMEIILGSPRHCGLNICARRTVSCLWTPKGERKR